MDGDGNVDVIAAHAAGNDVVVLVGDGTGVVSPAQRYAVGADPVSVGIGDLNGDGRLDVMTANHDDNPLSVLLHDGAGGLLDAIPIELVDAPRRLATADFNADGVADWVVTLSEAGRIAIGLSNP